MKISILCSDKDHPIYLKLVEWEKKYSLFHSVELLSNKANLTGGDILFLISCNEMIDKIERANYHKVLVIHASDLPKGKGWSPHIWQILNGENEIIVSLIEAEDSVDSGAIWGQRKLLLEGHELCDEINNRLFNLEIELMDFAVEQFENIKPKLQRDIEPTYYKRRTPEDSMIDITKTLEEQFELLRVVDPKRYPAFFDFRGHRYIIRLEKIENIQP